ncbi:RICIN domain-containing protein [Streptomyces sp. MST-110588]|uniref:RICIN domain-containing protein n=1 Tax=Streptomyces sp. MST-110588 TaxID=2833628 RepID=UPI001F5CFDBF|nr:RICIN domain-containing protein [Streptomyces sp. MST-110588]UNO38819.1 RICIN domain-containing protein [Streptomyces sp. MST-110588]
MRTTVFGAAGLLSIAGFAVPAGAASAQKSAPPTASASSSPTGLRLLPTQKGGGSFQPGTIVNSHSGKCLEIENSSKQNGARAQQWDCNGQAGSGWRLQDLGGGAWYIINAHSGKCLEIENSSASNGARAQQWDCKGQKGAKFWLDDRGSYWWIRPTTGSSDKCLEIENSSMSNGARAQQWDCNGQSGARWW